MSFIISKTNNLPTYRLVGYLSEIYQQSSILRLYGRSLAPNFYEYFAASDSHPFMRLPLCRIDNSKPLCDQELIKISGYIHSYRVNIYPKSFDTCEY